MASSSETGIAKNIANASAVVEACAGFGADYQPSNPLLTEPAIRAKQAAAAAARTAYIGADSLQKTKINDRVLEYLPLEKTVRKAMGIFETSGANAEILKDAKGYADKITGDNIAKHLRKIERERENGGTTPAADDAAGLGNSVSQLSYDRMLDNFKAFIELLRVTPAYNPGEADIKIVNLDILAGKLHAANQAVILGNTPFTEAEKVLNLELYEAEVGLVDRMVLVKKYVRKAFGARSARYKQISGLKFRKPEEPKN